MTGIIKATFKGSSSNYEENIHNWWSETKFVYLSIDESTTNNEKELRNPLSLLFSYTLLHGYLLDWRRWLWLRLHPARCTIRVRLIGPSLEFFIVCALTWTRKYRRDGQAGKAGRLNCVPTRLSGEPRVKSRRDFNASKSRLRIRLRVKRVHTVSFNHQILLSTKINDHRFRYFPIPHHQLSRKVRYFDCSLLYSHNYHATLKLLPTRK